MGGSSFAVSGVDEFCGGACEGPNIQSSNVLILAAPTLDPNWPPKRLKENTRSMFDSGMWLPQIYAAKFEHVAKPSRAISGVVRDAETGQPVAGVTVSGDVRGESDITYSKTDDNGHYSLTGLATEGQLRLFAVPRAEPDAPISPYIGVEREWIDFSTASPPTNTDFELVRGVIVRGNVTDETGAP